ncbi:MAG: beta-propeller domain-containing protein [Burkholderiales bacterium]|nr:beta-propeller domain-containing protein [Burkholderiales bacterium]
MRLIRHFSFLVALLLSSLSLAATVADRSPFTQGHWWDPARSGNGFEIFNAASTVQVIWYTFDERGRAVWYTAQGPESSLGREDWPLLHHRWEGGRKAEPTVVGSLRLTLRHAEAADVAWRVGARQGSWAIQPFYQSGVPSEVDHTGSWFDPANSGWGVSLTEQGEVLGGVVFTYDAAGDPTWVAGFQRGGDGGVAMYAATGSCPGCERAATVTRPAGRVTFEFSSETRLRLRTQLDLAMAAGVNADNSSLVMLGRPASMRAADRSLASFDSDARLRDYLASGVGNLTSPPVIVLPSPAPATSASPSFSGTNLQEEGVDEADLVKTNGRQVYTYAWDAAANRRAPRIRVARVEDEGATLVAAGSVALASGGETPMEESGLLLHDGRLVSVTGTKALYAGFMSWWYPGGWRAGTTHVEILDLGNPEAPASRWRAQVDGHFIATRRIGSRVFVVSRFAPTVPGYQYGTSNPAVLEANRRLVAGLSLADLLPKVRVNGGPATPAVPSGAVYLPPQGARVPSSELTLVTAIDLEAPGIVQALAIAGPVETVYASPDNLYVALTRQLPSADWSFVPEPTFVTTDIHQVRLGAGALAVGASGTVEGYLSRDPGAAPFRLGEHEGRLRVVSSSASMWGAATRNRLTILEPSTVTPGLLKTVSWLPNASRPEPLGKPGELVYGTRFVGDRLYAVTFRMADPLYVVDLSDAADPRIAGSLEIPGFSQYLHPLPGGLLLGFGKDAVPALEFGDGSWAWFQGLKVSLFDVSVPAAPREMRHFVVGKRGSESALLESHHAFSLLRRADGTLSLAIPAAVHDGAYPLYGSGPAAPYAWSHSGVLRFDVTGTTPANAQLVQRPMMVTHRTGGVSGPAYDPARRGGRSVIFGDGIVYVGNGQFWRGNDAGGAAGPY